MKSYQIDCAGYAVDLDFYDGKSNDNILLSLIGWRSNRKKYGHLLSALVEKTGTSAAVFDYSGHGDSDIDMMSTRPAQHLVEVICVYDWLVKQHPSAQLNVVGASYGGFLATHMLLQRDIASLVLAAPAIYHPDDFYSQQKNIDREWTDTVYRKDKAALSSNPLLAEVSRHSVPTLVVVHGNDELVPVETTDAYTVALDADVHVAKDMKHSLRDASDAQLAEYQSSIADWLYGKK